jgi:hypothetical protein
VAEDARAVRDVDATAEHRLHQALHLLRPVLAVRVERDHHARAGVDHQAIARAQRGAAAEVGHVPRHRRAVGAGDLPGPVARAVVDDEHRGADAADRGRDPREHLPDAVLLVVRRDDDGHAVAEALVQTGGAELLPGDALERRRELSLDPPVLDQRADGEQEEDDDGEDGEAEDATAAAALEREELQHGVQRVGPRDHEQPGRREQQEQHVAVAQRAAPPQRERHERDAEDEAEDPEGGELQGGRQDSGGVRPPGPRGALARARPPTARTPRRTRRSPA